MRIEKRLLAIAVLIVFAAGSVGAGETPPASQPTTAPATASVRGRVTVSFGLDLVKPDLSRVIVYVASEPALDALPIPAEHIVVAQHNKKFVPNFTVVRKGTIVEFPNWDHYDHNVFSRSKAAPAFDLDRYPYGQSKSRQFDKIGIVQMFCNVHPSMRAIVFVTPNGYFARADGNGQFELDGLPPGRHELVVWNERCEEQRKTVELDAGGSAEISFTLEPSRNSIMANDPPEKRGGYGVDRGLGVKKERLGLPVVEESHPAPPPAGEGK